MRLLAGLLGLAFVVGAVIHYFWWIVAALALYAAVKLANEAADRSLAAHTAQAAENARLIAQADRQHGWVCEGDERGIYGETQEAP